MNKRKLIKTGVWVLISILAVIFAHMYNMFKLGVNASFYIIEPLIVFWLAGLTVLYASYLLFNLWISSKLLSTATGAMVVSISVFIFALLSRDILTIAVILIYIIPEYFGTAVLCFIAYFIKSLYIAKIKNKEGITNED